jgi:hypothetical protein
MLIKKKIKSNLSPIKKLIEEKVILNPVLRYEAGKSQCWLYDPPHLKGRGLGISEKLSVEGHGGGGGGKSDRLGGGLFQG